MRYTFDRFRDQISQALIETGLVSAEEIDLQMPKAASVRADLALPCFKAASARKANPAAFAGQLAEALRDRLAERTLIGDVAAAGPFLNFSLNMPVFAREVLAEVAQHGQRYGWGQVEEPRPIILEYSSPNVAKRMHVGHIRSTIIGQALTNIYRAVGYNVVADNHMGDWGTNFGSELAAIERWGKPEGEGDEVIAKLEALYARYTGEAKENPELEEVARGWSLRLEQNDPTARELWQWIVDLTIRANARNYERLGVRFDTIHGESFYAPMLDEVIKDALDKGVANRDEGGAVVVEPEDLPSFLLQRSDGGTLYLTRDVATIKYREQTYHPSRIIYVVEQKQELHFRQVFAASRALGYVSPEAQLIHVQFGTIFAANGEPLSTRKGNMVYLEALLDDAITRARAIVDEKLVKQLQALGETVSEQEVEEIAQAVGIGGVIYNDLYQDSKRNITLDWERMLSLEGNSATYLQYTHARCRSIIRKAGGLPESSDAALLVEPAELAVVRQLAQLPAVLREAAERYAPFVIAEWLYSTARQFTAFYDVCPVLKAPSPELRAARLHLVSAVAEGLRNGLALLGVKAPERM